MSSLFQKTFSLFFPRRCPVCGELTDTATPQLCTNCAKQLETAYAHPCPVCHKKAAECRCIPSACEVDETPVRIVCLGFYEAGNPSAVTSRLVYALKHRTDDTAAHIFARDLSGRLLRDFLAAGEDIRTWTLTYAPRSPHGYEENGFDQARRLAKLCARYTGARFENVFSRCGGDVQKELNAGERQANAAQSIRLRNPRRRRTGKYILFDDIITTGATLAECAALLQGRGADEILLASALRTMPQPPRRRPEKELWFAPSGKYSQ